MILFRPVGLQELALIYDSGMKAFPADLPQKPIFYPVLDLEYARQTASDWNVKNGEHAGYVTQFKIDDQYIGKFKTHKVGDTQYKEFWIPADQMVEFNKHIIGRIKVVEAYFGSAFKGFVPDQFGLQGKKAVEQFTLLSNSYIYKRMDFFLEIKRNHKAVFLNYPFWQKHNFKNPALKGKIIQAIKEAWFTSFPQIPLVTLVPDESKLEKQTNSESSDEAVSPVQPTKPGDAHSTVGRAHENVPPEKQRDLRTPVKYVHKDITPVRPTNAPPPEKPVHKDVASVKPTASSSPVRPMHEGFTPPVQRGLHLSKGIELGLRENFNEAVVELSKAVEEDPNHVVARTSLGIAYHRLGEDDRALDCYESALKVDSRYAEAYYFRANILYQQGDTREAISAYTIAIGLDPQLIEAHQNPISEDRLTDYTDLPVSIHRLAKSAYRILDLNKALEATPRQTSLLKERAAEYSRLWNYERAIADYTTSLKIRPEDANALHFRGLAYEQIGQHERALEDFRQAVAVDPQLPDMYINRGIEFAKMGNFQQAIASLTDGIRLIPQSPDGYFNRGIAYFQEGSFESAIDDFSSVIRLSPNDDAAYYWRGVSNEQSGRQRDAIADYKQFLTLSQDPRARQEIERKLRQWTVGKPTDMGSLADKRKTSQGKSEKPHDLYGILVALGDRALQSIWFGTEVNCSGEHAEELYTLTDNNSPIQGHDLLRITSGIRQTLEGDFTAFDPDADSHWLFLRAWEGSGFYVEINDPQIKNRLKSQFPSVEDVEGVPAPYEGLFVHM